MNANTTASEANRGILTDDLTGCQIICIICHQCLHLHYPCFFMPGSYPIKTQFILAWDKH